MSMNMTNDGLITIDIGPAHRGLVHVLTGCAAPSARSKPVGRRARRAAFYDRNRRKAQGRVIVVDQVGNPVALPLFKGEWKTTVYGARTYLHSRMQPG